MMSVRLQVFGNGESSVIVDEWYAHFDNAVDTAFVIRRVYEREDFEMGDDGVFRRSGEWRKLVIVDSHGVTWHSPIGRGNGPLL